MPIHANASIPAHGAETRPIPQPAALGRLFRSTALAVGLALAPAAPAILGLLPQGAFAAAPAQKTQVAGWYRFMVGGFEVTALSDGSIELPVQKLLHPPGHGRSRGGAQDARNGRADLGPPTQVLAVNAWLVNTGARLVLVDAGAGGLFGPTLGRLVANLKAAGYQPEQVDDVLVTHMHPDHVGGLATADGKPVFPNATVRADKREAELWLSDARAETSPAKFKDFFKGAMASLQPYAQAGRLATFDGAAAAQEVVPGVRTWDTHGHTPGHTAYVVESEGRKLVLVGDLIHVASVQLPMPQVTIDFDSDEAQAAKIRAAVFGRLAKDDKAWVAVSHFGFPGVGRLQAEGKGWKWMPVAFNDQVR